MLNSKKKIRFIIYTKNRHAVQKTILLQSETFTYNNKTYFVDGKNYFMNRGLACYSYVENTATPISLKNLVVKKNNETVKLDDLAYSSQKLDTFIKSKTAKDILESVDNSNTQNMILFAVTGVLLLAIGGVYFTLSSQITDILNTVRELIDVINQGGGF